jgi:hypothetical protein
LPRAKDSAGVLHQFRSQQGFALPLGLARAKIF